MLEFDHVSVSFGDDVALDDVTLSIPPEKTTALIGPSGSGKSTLIRLVVGLVRPSAGEVRFDGTPVVPASAPALRRRLGYVIQEGGLFPHLTARENVTLAARVTGRPPAWISAKVNELAHLVHLPEAFLARYPLELSGGQRQRVGLMRALMLDPAVLLLDEPLGALDPLIRHDLQDELAELFARLAKTVLMVTHDVAEAAFLADYMVLLHEGRVVQQGTVAEFRDAPAGGFTRRFLETGRRGLFGDAR